MRVCEQLVNNFTFIVSLNHHVFFVKHFSSRFPKYFYELARDTFFWRARNFSAFAVSKKIVTSFSSLSIPNPRGRHHSRPSGRNSFRAAFSRVFFHAALFPRRSRRQGIVRPARWASDENVARRLELEGKDFVVALFHFLRRDCSPACNRNRGAHHENIAVARRAR